MNETMRAFTNEELIRKASDYRNECKSLLELMERKFGSTDSTDVEARMLRHQAAQLATLAAALEELRLLRVAAAQPELKSDPNLTGELARTPPPNDG